jgi:hypothetical protein
LWRDAGHKPGGRLKTWPHKHGITEDTGVTIR